MPTLELGVQITLLVYKMFGGNPASGRVPGEAANMFRYSGPRGAKVRVRDAFCARSLAHHAVLAVDCPHEYRRRAAVYDEGSRWNDTVTIMPGLILKPFPPQPQQRQAPC